MSNVVSPRGPLPPRVYWRRRLVMLGVVLALVLVVVQAFGGEETEPVAERGVHRPNAQAQPAPDDPGRRGGSHGGSHGGAGTPSRAEGDRASRDSGDDVAAPSSSISGAAGPTAPSSGPCATSDVLVVPDVEDADAFGPVPLRLGLSTDGTKPCTFSFGPDTVALRVTSGDDLIWESLHCGRALEEQSVVVRPGWLSYVTVDWSGRRGDDACGGGDFASPGYYWAEAAAIGGEPGRSQFELETPPEPEPTQKPSPQAGKKPSEEPSAGPSAGPTQPSEEPSRADGSGEPGGSGEQRDGEEKPVRPDRVGG